MTYKGIIKILFLMVLFVLTTKSYGQIPIPRFDVELKIHQSIIPGSGDADGQLEFLETTNIYGGAHVQINQYIAVGGFYSRSFRGISAVRYGSGNIKKDAQMLEKGFDVRFSTGRTKNWRYYLALNYFKVEMVQVNESFRLADESNAFGGSIGLMRRLSTNLYLNVMELGVKVMFDDMYWYGTDNSDRFILDAKIGLTYNIGKRK